ncbi:hypothetical protein Poli38472_011191 [Pythium oligandrum]|uniref:Uncharacterized protein n=1 Tax=Pythium oligandrum TaxID=41045 RepID=A0A8K1CRY7_PYTOL|nr:hypothetical protein Poli38472_011191 [Pythium oligandrum]|eukprot:TMW67571.1 hypothetical protein Poli38472_011191 [Pythium oligandrum]
MDDEILGEEERIYGEESEEEEEEEEEWIKYDIRRGPWAFLGDMFNSWFDRVEFTYAPLGKSQSMRFGHFHYYLPWEAEDSDERRERLREDREALELISLMLRVDPSSWFYTLKIRMHQRFRPGDDHAGAAAQCRQFLLGGALAPDDQKRGNQAYHKPRRGSSRWIGTEC